MGSGGRTNSAHRRARICLGACLFALVLGPLALAEAAPERIRLVSEDHTGTTTGNSGSAEHSISDDGRFVAFATESSNLVPGDNDRYSRDVFVRDLVTGRTELVSATPSGDFPRYGYSGNPEISGNGRYVVFQSGSTNLVPMTDQNGSFDDVFVRDLVTDTTRLVSVDKTKTKTANSSSYSPTISRDGRYVVFSSWATDIVEGDDSNDFDTDLFSHDTVTGATELVSQKWNGTAGGDGSSHSARLSDDGRYVTFVSSAPDLVPNDLNQWAEDVYQRDTLTDTTELVSINHQGTGSGRNEAYSAHESTDPTVSADGRFVAFESYANDLVPNDANWFDTDVFVRDLEADVTTLVSRSYLTGESGNERSLDARISADGSWIAFASYASDLAPGSTSQNMDIFLYERATGAIEEVSTTSPPTEGINTSYEPEISGDGRLVVFHSSEHGLTPHPYVPGDDIYEWDRVTKAIRLVSETPHGTQANDYSWEPRIARSGTAIVFASEATDLVFEQDLNGWWWDLFVDGGPEEIPPPSPVASTPSASPSLLPTTSPSGSATPPVTLSPSPSTPSGSPSASPSPSTSPAASTSPSESPRPDPSPSSGGDDPDGDGYEGDDDRCPRDRASSHHGCPTDRAESWASLRHDDRNQEFEGRIRSERGKCVSDRRVRLKRSVPGKDRLVGREWSDSSGRWAIHSGARRGTYYAVVAKGVFWTAHERLVCRSARSERVRI